MVDQLPLRSNTERIVGSKLPSADLCGETDTSKRRFPTWQNAGKFGKCHRWVNAMARIQGVLEAKLLLEKELRQQGIADRRVLKEMIDVPREEFVSKQTKEFAYQNISLPIGLGQTISQPFIVALMLQSLQLESEHRILDVGTGSGYAAAVLSRIVAEVFSIERHPSLVKSASERLKRLGYRNVHVRCGDGTLGWPDKAPFDGIVVAASGPRVPSALRNQLCDGGRLVIPIGESENSQQLMCLIRKGDSNFVERDLEAVKFVRLIGKQGWNSDDLDSSTE